MEKDLGQGQDYFESTQLAVCLAVVWSERSAPGVTVCDPGGHKNKLSGLILEQTNENGEGG